MGKVAKAATSQSISTSKFRKSTWEHFRFRECTFLAENSLNRSKSCKWRHRTMVEHPARAPYAPPARRKRHRADQPRCRRGPGRGQTSRATFPPAPTAGGPPRSPLPDGPKVDSVRVSPTHATNVEISQEMFYYYACSICTLNSHGKVFNEAGKVGSFFMTSAIVLGMTH